MECIVGQSGLIEKGTQLSARMVHAITEFVSCEKNCRVSSRCLKIAFFYTVFREIEQLRAGLAQSGGNMRSGFQMRKNIFRRYIQNSIAHNTAITPIP